MSKTNRTPQAPTDTVQVIAKTRLFKSADEIYIEAGQATSLDRETAKALYDLGFVEYAATPTIQAETNNEE